jgi:hypothetical protein
MPSINTNLSTPGQGKRNNHSSTFGAETPKKKKPLLNNKAKNNKTNGGLNPIAQPWSSQKLQIAQIALLQSAPRFLKVVYQLFI